MKRTLLLAAAALTAATNLLAAPAPVKVPLLAEPFPLPAVRLLDGPFKAAMQRDQQYLLALDADRLLHTFRLNVKLPSTAQPLGGWEEPNC